MKSIRTKLAQCRQWIKEQSLAKKLLLIGMILLLLSPTLFAVLYTIRVKHAAADSFSVTLYTEDGQEIVSEEGDPTNVSSQSLLGIFHHIATLTQPMSKPPEPTENDRYVLAKCVWNGTPSQWQCYFSSIGVDSYCVGANGTAYAIDKTTTKNFLSTEYGEFFYRSAIPPALKTIDLDAVTPSSVNWYYQSLSGSFLKVNYPQTASEKLLYDMTGAIHLEFARTPDTCEVSVFDGEQELFRGNPSGLSALTVELGSILDVSVHAEWLRSARYESYGSVDYDFSVRIRNQSEFSIHTDTVAPGEFVILSCTNISDLSKIKFTPAKEGIIPTPVFHRDGQYVRTLLAFPDNTTATEYSFSIAYGASHQDFSIQIRPNATQVFSYPNLNPDPSLQIDATREVVSSTLASMPQYDETPLYFRGAFGDPAAWGWSVSYTHGSSVQYGTKLNQAFVAFGSAFKNTASDTRVLSLHNGIIALVDYDPTLGNFIVIDHGGGLRTWYCHLQNCNVEEGTTVKKGDLLGRVGTNAVSEHPGILILCTLYDTVLDPSYVIGKEFSIPTV